MRKYTELECGKCWNLYENFLFNLQKKYNSNEIDPELFEFALRYALLPQFYRPLYQKHCSSNSYSGYLLFLQEKFDIDLKIESNLWKNFDFLYDNGLIFREILKYSFSEIMEKSTTLGTKTTTKMINEIFTNGCFDALRWGVTKGRIAKKINPIEEKVKISILNQLQNMVINNDETNIEKSLHKIKNDMVDKSSIISDEFLYNIQNSIMYHNAIRVLSLEIVQFFIEFEHQTHKLNENFTKSFKTDTNREM